MVRALVGRREDGTYYWSWSIGIQVDVVSLLVAVIQLNLLAGGFLNNSGLG